MKQMRKSVFETNSSSCHSLAISRKAISKSDFDFQESVLKNLIASDNYLHIDLDEFGWEIFQYTSAEVKLCYILTMLCSNEGLDDWYGESTMTVEERNDKLQDSEEFQKINDLIKSRVGCKGIYINSFVGYIDHQSMYDSVFEFLRDYDVTLEEFIFNPNVILYTDNDNH